MDKMREQRRWTGDGSELSKRHQGGADPAPGRRRWLTGLNCNSSSTARFSRPSNGANGGKEYVTRQRQEVSTRRRAKIDTAILTLLHYGRFFGAGIIISIGYIDPGNWTTDISGASTSGYKLLCVILLANLVTLLMQGLAAKLSIVTRQDLAQLIRFHFRPAVTIPLYILAEIAVVATDLAELLGSAIALKLLIPALPLWAGVIITSADVLLILLAYKSDGSLRALRVFEIMVGLLVFAVLICFIILLGRLQPDGGEVMKGYLPSRELFQADTLYAAIGIIGATIMPHNIYIGGRLAADRTRLMAEDGELEIRISDPDSRKCPSLHAEPGELSPTQIARHPQDRPQFLLSTIWKNVTNLARAPALVNTQEGSIDISSLTPMILYRRMLLPSLIDLILSLTIFAFFVNSAILIVAAAAFYYNSPDGPLNVADLFSAHELLASQIGSGSGVIFAIALLASGQSSSITATLAGQIISEGFIEWRLNPLYRRLITRVIGIIPSTIIAAVIGRSGLNNLLIGSQVALSILLPFTLAPLLLLCGNRQVMQVRMPASEDANGYGNISKEDSDMADAASAKLGDTEQSVRCLDPASQDTSHPLNLSSLGPIEHSDADSIRTISTLPLPLPLSVSRPSTSMASSVLGDPPSDTPEPISFQSPLGHSQTPIQILKDVRVNWWTLALGWLLFSVLTTANVYLIVELGLGNS